MRLLDLLAEALSAEKEAVLRDKFVQVMDKKNPMAGMDPNKISEKEFKALLDIDQTPNGTYMNWILPRYVKMNRTERKRFFEDGHNEQVKELLVFFDKNKQKIKKININGFQADINLYKTLEDFENILGAAKAKVEGEGDKANIGPGKLRGAFIEPIKILGTTPSGFTVYKIPQICKDNEDCYRKYSDLTGCGDPTFSFSPDKEGGETPKSGYRVTWCTRNSPQFFSHLAKGPMFLFKNWNTRRQYQLHYESGQLKDEANRSIQAYNGKLQNEFLQFLLDKEGRIPSKSMSFDLDLSKFKIGETENGFPVYEIGNKLYMDFGQNKDTNLWYYDDDEGTLKTSSGTDKTYELLNNPYSNLVRFAYSKGKKVKTPIRILLQIDLPPNVKYKINSSVDLNDTDITSLPDRLIIQGNLNLAGSKIKEIPNNLTVTDTLVTGGLPVKSDTEAGKIVK